MTTQISISRSIIFTVAFGLLGKPATAQYVRQLDDGPVITAYFQHAACGETENRDWHCGTNTYTSISADGKCYTHSGLDEGIPCLKATTKQILANGKVTTVRDQCLDYDHFAILAAADGYVLFTKEDCPDTCGTGSCFCPDARGIGNQVRLIDKFGRLLSFGHMRLQSVPDEITVGARVSCGDQLGEIGSSGNSTGPHLHFQVEYFNTEPTDPHDAIGKAVDPFGADWSDTRSGYCSDQTSTLWLDQPAYDQMPTSNGGSLVCRAGTPTSALSRLYMRVSQELVLDAGTYEDIFRADATRMAYEQLVSRAIAYLPMPRNTATPKVTAFAALAEPEMAARLIGAMPELHLEKVRAEVVGHPSRIFANALTNTAWRNGPVENIHAGKYRGYPLDHRRMALTEERKLMSFASERLALGMMVCRQFAEEQSRRPWTDQVLPYGLAELLSITPSGWTLTETSREVRLKI